jgi:gamma-D-glutamyl-L-lysine dipeptidyl-peptidase
MLYGYCHLPLVPCRAEPSNKSEMVTQLLFGEHFFIHEIKEDEWIKIESAIDGYQCWISFKQFRFISELEFNLISKNNHSQSVNLMSTLTDPEFGELIIPSGARLPNLDGANFKIQNRSFTFLSKSIDTKNLPTDRTNIIETAKRFMNAPYLWGGKSILGIDCSGFTQLVYSLNGIQLKRDASQQAEQGQPLSFVEEAQAGDLAFFDNEEGKIVHVGIMLDNTTIIHASGQVRIDKIDHYGIFHTEKKKYSHLLRVIKNRID